MIRAASAGKFLCEREEDDYDENGDYDERSDAAAVYEKRRRHRRRTKSSDSEALTIHSRPNAHGDDGLYPDIYKQLYISKSYIAYKHSYSFADVAQPHFDTRYGCKTRDETRDAACHHIHI